MSMPSGTGSANRPNDYITETRVASRQIWDGINKLKSLQPEWSALDYTTTLPDGVNHNEGITNADVKAVVWDAANGLTSTMEAGIAAMMAKLL